MLFHSHKTSAFLLCIALLLPSPSVLARVVRDHTNAQVQVPDHPLRVVSLHDWTLTVMSYELGVQLIGSTGRLAANGNYFIRGAQELFGLGFDNITLASVHGKLDLERIRLLNPDIILGNVGDVARLRENLTTIAPVLLFAPNNGQRPLELYRQFASWVGKTEQFEKLYASYQSNIHTLQRRLSETHIDGASYIVLTPNGRDGTLTVHSEYGVLTTLLDDLGLKRLPITDEISNGKSSMIVSPEMLDRLDADFIITAYLGQRGETADTFATELSRLAPGAQGFLKAFDTGDVISFPRNQVYPTSFKGLNQAMSIIERTLAPLASPE